ncbi:hypothetical protein ES705_36114 [subsurface metagenome]
MFLHRSVHDYTDFLAGKILNKSRSETIEDMLRYIFNEDLEGKVWDEYDDSLEAYEDEIKEYEKWADENLPDDEDDSEDKDEERDESEEESLLED